MKALALTALCLGFLLLPATPAYAGDGSKALKLMPGDTNVVVNLNVRRLRQSKAFGEILAQARNNPSFAETEASLKKAGVNIRKDIDTITVGVRADGKGEPAGLVVVAKGRFKEARIVKAFRANNEDLKRAKHKGVVYYHLGSDGAIAFLGKDVVLAENDRITDVIDRFKAKGKKSAAKSRLIKRMKGRTDIKKDIWFVAEIRKNGSFGVPMADKLRSLVGSFDMGSGLAVKMRAGFANTKVPKEVVAQFDAFRPTAANMEQVKALGLDPIINKAVLVADEKDLLFRVSLSPDEAKKLRGLADTMGGAI